MRINNFIRFCLAGLEKMYIPAEHIFCESYALSGETMVHRRDPAYEYMLTMNILMALHHARKNGHEIFLDIESDYHALLPLVDAHSHSTEDIAATVWTSRCLGLDIPPNVTAHFENLFHAGPEKKIFPSSKALAWAIIAFSTNEDKYYEQAFSLAKLAMKNYVNHKTNLVRQKPAGFRRNYASFGAESYMAFAFLLLARKTGSDWARHVGLDIARKLVQLQGEQGQWEWMYHVPRGIVVDYYPVYSVHQYAYAPLFLTAALDLGYDEFREPLLKGFRWILGQNEVGESMVAGGHGVIWRGLKRRPPNSKFMKIARGPAAARLGIPAGPKQADSLIINRRCRSFEMALPLCIFCGRDGFEDILNDPVFS